MIARTLARKPTGNATPDWAWWVLPLLALVAVWSFVTQPLPSTDDGAVHLLRLVEVDRCLRHGVLPLRWAPDFALGYGYPGFNYYMNLPTFIAEVWHLAGFDFPEAIGWSMASAFVVAGWGMYLLVRAMAGRRAGWVAAVAYMYAPYFFYDSAYRGNLPETWALAELPWLLWAARRATLSRRWRDILPCVLAYAALIWTHNLYALIASPLLVVYLALLWWRAGRSRRGAWRLATMLALGLALAAFFWMPALFESDWTRYSPGLFDYETHFLSLSELLAPPPQLDLSLLNPYPPRSLGWGMLVLLALGGVLLAVRAVRVASGDRQAPAARLSAAGAEWLLFALLGAGAALMSLRAMRFLWQAVPPLQVVQMPWRFLGFAALGGSVCAGGAIVLLIQGLRLRGRWAWVAAGTAIAGLVVAAFPWTYAQPFPQPRQANVTNIVRWEISTGLIGTTSDNEFLPTWAARVPPEPADPALLDEADPIIARLDEGTLPAGATVLAADYELLRAELVIDTPLPFRAHYKQFYFPGWRVTVDGKPVSQIAIAPYGLLGFDVPAGRHTIVVRPWTTPLRALGSALSLAAALVAAGIALWGGRHAETQRDGDTEAEGQESLPAHPRAAAFPPHWAALALLALLLLGSRRGPSTAPRTCSAPGAWKAPACAACRSRHG
jgi:hypothetical protein